MTDPAQQLESLLSALAKLPPYRGLSYRGFVEAAPTRPGRAIVSPLLIATSKDPRVATADFTTPGVYAVIGSLGRDLSALSAHPREQEIVFRPGTMFLPIQRFDVEGLEVAIVEELDPEADTSVPPPFTLEQVKDQIRGAIAEARAGGPADGVTPGKFVGGLA